MYRSVLQVFDVSALKIKFGTELYDSLFQNLDVHIFLVELSMVVYND
jgi:hypothetical protein